ncbi:MAG: SEC-C domain-containing protein [Lachnospiraceae bacterium]|nr:SEC-C domain-containing protein [Lachnospiraceae bacterium]
MSLLKKWDKSLDQMSGDPGAQQRFFVSYYQQEQAVYEQLLTAPVEPVKGTVKDLAEKYGMTPVIFAGFLDGINDSLKEPVADTYAYEEDSEVNIDIDLEKLYKNMVKAKADWLYNLEQWDALIPEERRKELYKEQKLSTTVVKGKKIGRNDPCPCGSGKKYKHCCGKNA